MNLLTQLRKDPAKFEAESAAVVVVDCLPSPSPPAPPPPKPSYPPPVVNGRGVRPDGWWQDCLVVPGDQMWPPAVPGDGAGDDQASTLAPIADVLPANPPHGPAAPCSTCGGEYFWGDKQHRAHCCHCTPIPSRRVASGESWRVAWVGGQAAWRDWEPQHWRPFAHLEAAERERDERAAAAEAAQGGGF
jgi:hypothetical protein